MYMKWVLLVGLALYLLMQWMGNVGKLVALGLMLVLAAIIYFRDNRRLITEDEVINYIRAWYPSGSYCRCLSYANKDKESVVVLLEVPSRNEQRIFALRKNLNGEIDLHNIAIGAKLELRAVCHRGTYVDAFEFGGSKMELTAELPPEFAVKRGNYEQACQER